MMTAHNSILNFLLPSIEAIVNVVSDANSIDKKDKFETLEGKVIAVQVVGLGLKLFITIINGSVVLLREYNENADATISGPPLALLNMALSDDIVPILQSKEVGFEGDTRLAQKFKHLMSVTSVDWEEQLAALFGDMPAYSLGKWFRQAKNWSKRTSDSVNNTTGEYLQEEIHSLPTRIEVENFMNDIDELRLRTDRLMARLKNITNNSNKN